MENQTGTSTSTEKPLSNQHLAQITTCVKAALEEQMNGLATKQFVVGQIEDFRDDFETGLDTLRAETDSKLKGLATVTSVNRIKETVDILVRKIDAMVSTVNELAVTVGKSDTLVQAVKELAVATQKGHTELLGKVDIIENDVIKAKADMIAAIDVIKTDLYGDPKSGRESVFQQLNSNATLLANLSTTVASGFNAIEGRDIQHQSEHAHITAQIGYWRNLVKHTVKQVWALIATRKGVGATGLGTLLGKIITDWITGA